tara:strand:+ start:277 stop:624 length:348 start_codon:yes stop_codon:yes gene_type:complete
MEVRYTLGMCRLYGKEYNGIWTEVNDQVLMKIKGALGWEIRDESVVEEKAIEVVEEVVEVTVEEILETVEIVDEVIDLSKLTKKELQALCNEQGLEYKAFDTKNTLLSLLSDEEE